MNRTQSLIKGLEILAKYDKHKEAHECAEHDMIYAGPDDHRDVSDDHAKELEDLGWSPDRESERWVFYP